MTVRSSDAGAGRDRAAAPMPWAGALAAQIGRQVVGQQRLVDRLLADAAVEPVVATSPGVEVTRRAGEHGSFLFVLNHTDADAAVPCTGVELITGVAVQSTLKIAAGDVAVVREEA